MKISHLFIDVKFSLIFLLPVIFLLIAPLVRDNYSQVNLTKFAMSQTGECKRDAIIEADSQIDNSFFIAANEFTLFNNAKLSEAQIISTKSKTSANGFFVLYGRSAKASISLLDISANWYQLKIFGKNDQPGPVLVRLSANQIVVGLLEFDANDDSWETKCLVLRPEYWSDFGEYEKILFLEFSFINDGGPNGNRDAALGWIRIEPFVPSMTER